MTVHDYHSIRLRTGLYALTVSGASLANTLVYLEAVLSPAWYKFALVVAIASICVSLDILKNHLLEGLRQRRSRQRQTPAPVTQQPLAVASRAGRRRTQLVQQRQITLSNGDVVDL